MTPPPNKENWTKEEAHDKHCLPDRTDKQTHVLVVDDEPGFRSMLQWELGSRGMIVEVAINGAEAVKLIKEKTFDLVITDLTMPILDGLMLLEAVKQLTPETEVIMATGFGTVETAVHAMQQGAYDFVLKPYDFEKLTTRIKQAMSEPSPCQCKHRTKRSKEIKKETP